MAPKSIIPIEKTMSVGNIAAETDDEFLFQCFIDHPAKSLVENMQNSKCFLLGSTGAGKTAILRKIEAEQERATIIELNDLSMGYISNSDVIRFLHTLEVPLDYFFQALWRHVLILEFIRTAFDVEDDRKSKGLWQRLEEYFQNNQAKKTAIRYLADWSDKFWVPFDENIREIEKSLEMNVSATAGAEYEKFKTDAGFNSKISGVKRSQLQARLKKAVDSNLLAELARVTDALAEYSKSNGQRHVYVLIDGLDENWVDSNVKYRLIRALIEATKSLRKIRNLKVIASIRSDLLEKVISETRTDGFQSEKYEDLFARISWKKDDLVKLLEKRVNFLYRNQYHSENVHLKDILPLKVKKKKTTEFILERTLNRPRDAIAFFNLCLANSENKVPLSERTITKAENVYSEDRRKALVEEWMTVFPCLQVYLDILKQRNASFSAAELYTSKTIEDLSSDFIRFDNRGHDPLWRPLEKAYDPNLPTTDGFLDEIVSELLQSLHLVGAIGLNTQPHEPFHWFYLEQHQIAKNAISNSAKIRVHPMLHSALGIR